MKILVTGGAGFIGSNFIHYWLKNHPDDEIVNLDKLTYAGNPFFDKKGRKYKPLNLVDVDKNSNYKFEQFDITCPIKEEGEKDEEKYGRFDRKQFRNLINWIKKCDAIVHFAAESHVDRSVLFAGPDRPDAYDFVLTNTWGTHIMLEAAVKAWEPDNFKNKRFHHVSTDEVFGALALDDPNKFNEQTIYNPRSPYAASKAAADHLVRAYHISFGLPITISNTANNYGPYMYPEKLLPLAITNLMQNKKVPIYGDGKYIRDWLYVEDHCQAIDLVLQKGKIGETYCIGGLTDDVNNLELIKRVLKIMDKGEEMLEFVKDRPGHDRRYAVDWSKAKNELGYEPKYDLDTYLAKMIQWYQDNEDWWRKLIEKKEHQDYINKQYKKR